MTLKIAVLDDWLGVAPASAEWTRLADRGEVRFFSEPIPPSQAPAILREFDIIVPMRERTEFPRSLLEQLPNLKMLALTGFLTDHIDAAYCVERGILVTGSGIYTPNATAELTFALMLAATRQIPAADARIRSGHFQVGLGASPLLAGATLGIVGLGKIGARVAEYARAFGMTVIAWSANLTAETAELAGARSVSKAELFETADIVSVHLKYSPRTHHVIAAQELAAMKAGALLINTARSALVSTEALLDALHAGRIHAALDVFDEEPLPPVAPILAAPNTVLTPHLGFSTLATFRNFYGQCVENIEAFLADQPIRTLSV